MADLYTSDTVNAGADAIKHENATIMRLWQDNAGRMIRANERVMHGMMSAVKLEIELGQHLVEHRINAFRQASQADKPAAAGQTVVDSFMQEMERLTATMREVSEEMRRSFGEATKIIFDHQEQNLHDAVAVSPPVQAAKFVAKAKPEAAPAKVETVLEKAESESAV
jgi:hypothetical protein